MTAAPTPTFEQANGLIAATFIQNLLRRGVDLSTDERLEIVESCRALTAQLVPQRKWATFDTAHRDGRYILALTGEAPTDNLRAYAYRAFVVRCLDPGKPYESWSLFPGVSADASFFTLWAELDLPAEAGLVRRYG